MPRHLCALALAFSLLLVVAPRTAPADTGVALYLSGPAYTDEASTLARLDPAALADLPLPPIEMPSAGGYTSWVISNDGATVVALAHPPEGVDRPAEASVLDLATGTERVRFELPLAHGNVRVNHDGTRLVMT